MKLGEWKWLPHEAMTFPKFHEDWTKIVDFFFLRPYIVPKKYSPMCCLLYFFLLRIMFPYTRRSLNRKNCLGLGFFLQALVRTPSPTRTRPGTFKGWPEAPKQPSTSAILRAFASLFTENKKNLCFKFLNSKRTRLEILSRPKAPQRLKKNTLCS